MPRARDANNTESAGLALESRLKFVRLVAFIVFGALALLWQRIFRAPPPATNSEPPVAPAASVGTDAPAGAPGADPLAAGPDSTAESAPLAFGVQVPFGPMLAAGGLVYFLFAHRWIDAYFASIAEMM